MKRTSRTGVRNAHAKAEKRSEGPPKISKYAAKMGRGGVEFKEAWLDEFGPAVEDLAAKYARTHRQ